MAEKEIKADLPSVNIVEAKRLVEVFINLKRPVFLHGPVGVGKSEIIAQIGKEQNRNVIDLRMSQMDISDLRGIPFFNTKSSKMEWAPPVCLPTDPKDTSIIFLDEINCASPAIQASAYQLILDRKIGDYHLPEGCALVAAGNRDKDRGATFKIATPLLNRFVHLDVKCDSKVWLDWAKVSNVHPLVFRYIKENEKDLVTFDPKTNNRAFATPRSWKYVSDCFHHLFKESASLNKDRKTLMLNMVASCVGEPLAIKYLAWHKTNANVDYDEILSGQLKDLPKGLDEESKLSNLMNIQDGLVTKIVNNFKNLKGSNINESVKFYGELDNAFSFLSNAYENNREHLYNFVQLVLHKYKVPLNQERTPSMTAFINRLDVVDFVTKAAAEKF